MTKCRECGFPDSRPGLIFKDGVCQACINFRKRSEVDWAERKNEFKELCQAIKEGSLCSSGYDCLIPVSGGKDSHVLVQSVEDEGLRPLLFNVSDWFTQTKAGKHNLENLAKRHDLVVQKMSRDLFVMATRAAFEETGEALKYIEYLIYLWPIQYAQRMGINMVLFGEDSAFQYGSSEVESITANAQIERMVEKFEAEIPFWESVGISEREVRSSFPKVEDPMPSVYWMSYFKPWSSKENLELAKSMGFWTLSDTGEWDRQGVFPDDDFEQIDSVAYLVHLYLKFPKFGFQRVTDIATRRWRLRLISAEERDEAIAELDPILDPWARRDFCETLGYTKSEFWAIVKKGWNKSS